MTNFCSECNYNSSKRYLLLVANTHDFFLQFNCMMTQKELKMEKNSAMTSFMITFTSNIWIISLLCKDIWSLHYIVFFVDFFRITVIKVWLLLVRGSTATGNDHLCDAWELFSRFSSTHVLIYLSTLSREVFDEKSVLTFTYDASSFLFEIFPAPPKS